MITMAPQACGAGMTETSMPSIGEGSLLWEPSADQRQRANLTTYVRWLRETRGLTFDSYEALWRWSVDDLEAFWASIWEIFDIKPARTYDRVLDSHAMPGAHWFPGAELNFAEHALRRRDAHPA